MNTADGETSKRIIDRHGRLPVTEFGRIVELNMVGMLNLNRLEVWHMSRARTPSRFATGLPEGASDELIAVLTSDAAFPKRAGRPVERARLVDAIGRKPMLNGQTIRLHGGQRFAPR